MPSKGISKSWHGTMQDTDMGREIHDELLKKNDELLKKNVMPSSTCMLNLVYFRMHKKCLKGFLL